MKRILLASTAVAGFAALVQPAMAADPITVTLGGTYEFYSGWRDTNLPGEVGHDFRTDPEVHIRAKGTADNGLEYGIKFEIETGDGGRGLRTDEAVGFISGTFGIVEFGDEDGASDRLAVYAPTVGFAQLDGDYDVFTNGFTPAFGTLDTTFFKAADTSDSTKVSYFSPKFYGLQAGISYAAELGGGNEADSVATGAGIFNDVIEGGVSYNGEFSGVKLGASFTITDGNYNVSRNTLNGRETGSDFTAWQTGASISYAGFTLGGGYVDQGDVPFTSANGTVRVPYTNDIGRVDSSWNVGASYVFGPVSVATQYAEMETNARGGNDTLTAWGFGAAYTVAPGLVVASDVILFDNESVATNAASQAAAAAGAGSDAEGYVFLVGTILSF